MQKQNKAKKVDPNIEWYVEINLEWTQVLNLKNNTIQLLIKIVREYCCDLSWENII